MQKSYILKSNVSLKHEVAMCMCVSKHRPRITCHHLLYAVKYVININFNVAVHTLTYYDIETTSYL